MSREGGGPTKRALGARAAAALVLAGLSASAARAELTYEQILEALPGTWEIVPSEAPDGERGDHRCDASPLSVRLSESEGVLVYESRRLGQDDTARRAPVRRGPRAILIQYDNEDRATPGGALVEWYLLMPDADHFYWVRADWAASRPGARTAMRRRCPSGPIA